MRSGNTKYVLEPIQRVMTKYEYGPEEGTDTVLSQTTSRLSDSSDKGQLELEASLLYWADTARTDLLRAE